MSAGKGDAGSPELDLIGREEQLELVRSRLEETIEGTGQVVLIAGDAGIGKSALAAAAATMARRRGATVAWGRCWGGASSERWWPWHQVLRSLEAPAELATPRGERMEVFAGVRDFLAAHCEEQPVMLVLDDLHDADESSLSLFEFVSREAISLRLFVLGTYRDVAVELEPSWRAAIHSAARPGTRIVLTGLDREATSKYLERLVGYPPPASLIDSIQRGTEGNPYFIQELAGQSQSPGGVHRPDLSAGFRVPRGVREILRQRVATLPQDTQETLTIAAVIGRSFGTSLVAEVTRIPVPQLLKCLEPALDGRVVVERSLGELAFDHPMIRETLYEDCPPGDRIEIHRRIGEELERSGTRELTARQLGDLAHHFFKAAPGGDIDKAIAYAAAAGEAAMESEEPHTAARHYLRAERLLELAGASEDTRRQMHQRFQEASSGSAYAAGEPDARADPTKPPEKERRPALYRSGDFWTVRYQGIESHVKETRGLHHLSRILAFPGKEIHAMDLAAGFTTGQASSVGREEDLTAGRPADAGPLLDGRAIRAYRARMAELEAELEEAESYNDTGRSAKARAEIDALKDELTRTVGLSGKSRRGASPSDRARVSVTKSIRLAIERLGEADPELGRHLDTTVRTGTYCSYQPDPRSVPNWDLARPR